MGSRCFGEKDLADLRGVEGVDGHFQPAGALQNRDSNAPIVAATKPDLFAPVERGNSRTTVRQNLAFLTGCRTSVRQCRQPIARACTRLLNPEY